MDRQIDGYLRYATRSLRGRTQNIGVLSVDYYYGSRMGRVFSGVCAFACTFVCLSDFPHDISKTDAARITKLNTDMVHHESWKSDLFWGQKLKGQGYESQKILPGESFMLS